MSAVPVAPAAAHAPRWRQWPRFRLRTLLVLFAFACGWLGWLMHGVHKQQAALAVLEKHKPDVGFHAFSGFAPWRFLPKSVRTAIHEALPEQYQRVTSIRLPENAQLSAAELASLDEFPHLLYLRLCGPNVTDESLAHLEVTTGLRTLCLLDTKVGDAGLRHISELEELEYLIITNAPITDEGIKCITRFSKLDELYIEGTKVTGECLDDVSRMESLRVIKASETQIAGSGLTHLARMKNLEIVDLKGTPISDVDIPYLRKVPDRVAVYVDSTNFSADGIRQLPRSIVVRTVLQVPKASRLCTGGPAWNNSDSNEH